MTNSVIDEQHNILKGYNMLLYFAGTMIMFDPSNECIYDFWSQGILKTLPVSSRNPRFIKAASQLRESVGDTSSTYMLMKDDYLALFSGKGKPLAPPYESVYRDNDHLLFGKQTINVRSFYESYGWVSRYRDKIPDDHLGVELLFLTILIEKYLDFDDKSCHVEMSNEIKRFLEQHILTWIPKWNEAVQQNARTLSYRGIGTLVQACAEDIYSILCHEEDHSPSAT